ncbi:DUF4287 domain-containing protein [soil metagenome]
MTSSGGAVATEKAPSGDAQVKGPASYFPSIEKKYGRPISDWQDIVRAHPEMKHMELVALLKSEYEMGHGHANAVVAYTLAEDAKD